MEAGIKKLSNEQTSKFDKEYVVGPRLEVFIRLLSEKFSRDEVFNVIDIGGGNGALADKILAEFPSCRVTVLDNSSHLLEKNSVNERKDLICCSAADLATKLPDKHYDLACFHWVLHHFVTQGYEGTIDTVINVLAGLQPKMKDNARFSVFENMYDGYFGSDYPGKIIFELTSLEFLAPIFKKMGANTAGIGVCFHSSRAWDRIFARAGLATCESDVFAPWDIPLYRKLILSIDSVRVRHFWLMKN